LRARVGSSGLVSLCTWIRTVRHMAAEIISTIERRRNWPAQEKLRIMEEALTPGASIAAVSDRNGVCRSLLYTWLRLARADRMPGISITSQAAASFVPVRIEALAMPQTSGESEPDAGPPAPPRAPLRGRRSAQVEVTLTNGRLIKVDEGIDPASLGAIVAALDGGTR
jgi:transposase